MSYEVNQQFKEAYHVWMTTPSMFAAAIAGCQNSDDKQVYEDFEYAKIFMDEVLARPDAQEYIMENLHEDEQEVELFEYYKVLKWENGDYYQSGTFAAKVSSIIGLAPPVPPFYMSAQYDELKH